MKRKKSGINDWKVSRANGDLPFSPPTQTRPHQCQLAAPCCHQSGDCRGGSDRSGWLWQQPYSRRDASGARPPASVGPHRNAVSSSSCSRCGNQTGHLWSPQNADESVEGRRKMWILPINATNWLMWGANQFHSIKAFNNTPQKIFNNKNWPSQSHGTSWGPPQTCSCFCKRAHTPSGTTYTASHWGSPRLTLPPGPRQEKTKCRDMHEQSRHVKWSWLPTDLLFCWGLVVAQKQNLFPKYEARGWYG